MPVLVTNISVSLTALINSVALVTKTCITRVPLCNCMKDCSKLWTSMDQSAWLHQKNSSDGMKESVTRIANQHGSISLFVPKEFPKECPTSITWFVHSTQEAQPEWHTNREMPRCVFQNTSCKKSHQMKCLLEKFNLSGQSLHAHLLLQGKNFIDILTKPILWRQSLRWPAKEMPKTSPTETETGPK